ncbi:MAG: cytoplasmic protein [Burkholderiales bacterium]
MNDILDAHKHSSNHREEVLASGLCGCFYCLGMFAPAKITEWIDWPEETPAGDEQKAGTTALCPVFGIDSVIGDKAGYPIDETFLKSMNRHWF